MKNQKFIRSIILGLVGLFVLTGVSVAQTTTVSLNPVTIPAWAPTNPTASSATFNVANQGQFSVTVRLRTDVLFGGQTQYRAELMRGTTVLDSEERIVSSAFENVSLSYNVTNCNQTGTYRIRVRNVQGPNPQQGRAEFYPFQVPSITPISGNLPIFGVTQGNTVDRSIPENLEPFGTGGTMRVTATWDGICLPDAAGCQLTFRLRRNGTTMASDNGYAQNALVPPGSRMSINYNVPANQVAGDWSLQVVGSQINSVVNVRPTVSFTPVCQN